MRADRAGVGEVDEAVHVDAVAVMIAAVADVVTVAGDRAVVDDGHDFLGVEAVDIDARAVVALDRRAGIVGHAHREAHRRVDRAAGDAVPPAFDQAAGIVGDLHAAVVLRVDAVAAGADHGRRDDLARIVDDAVDAGPHRVRFVGAHDAGREIVDGIGARENGVEVDDLRAARRGVQRGHRAVVVQGDAGRRLVHLNDVAIGRLDQRVELVALPLVIVRPVTPVLSRIARPVPVCSSVPRFVSVALLPVMVTAFVPPLTVSDPVSVIVPVCPAPEPRVCAVVDGAGDGEARRGRA